MASVRVDPKKVREFADEQSFYEWLREHWNREQEVWIKMRYLPGGTSTPVFVGGEQRRNMLLSRRLPFELAAEIAYLPLTALPFTQSVSSPRLRSDGD